MIRPLASGVRGQGEGPLPTLDFGHILLNLFIILVFEREWLRNFKIFIYIKALELIAVLFLLLAPFLVPCQKLVGSCMLYIRRIGLMLSHGSRQLANKMPFEHTKSLAKLTNTFDMHT